LVRVGLRSLLNMPGRASCGVSDRSGRQLGPAALDGYGFRDSGFVVDSGAPVPHASCEIVRPSRRLTIEATISL